MKAEKPTFVVGQKVAFIDTQGVYGGAGIVTAIHKTGHVIVQPRSNPQKKRRFRADGVEAGRDCWYWNYIVPHDSDEAVRVREHAATRHALRRIETAVSDLIALGDRVPSAAVRPIADAIEAARKEVMDR